MVIRQVDADSIAGECGIVPGDVLLSMGSVIDVKLYQAFEGSKLYTGVLTACTPTSVTIETNENEITFDCSEAAKISLHLDL